MDNLDPVWVEPKLENLLDSLDLIYEQSPYSVYFEPLVRGSDIAFGYRKQGQKDIDLFQITVDVRDKNVSKEQLSEIDFKQIEVLRELVAVGEELKKSYNPQELGSLNTVWGDFVLSYQADDVKILDESLHEQYYKKLKERKY